MLTMTGVAQLFGHLPTKQKFTGSIPNQVICLGCRFGLSLVRAHMREATN